MKGGRSSAPRSSPRTWPGLSSSRPAKSLKSSPGGVSPLGSGLNFFTNAVNKTPGSTGAWVDVDCSADIPSGASGVILELYNTTASKIAGAVRKNGSTDGQTNHSIVQNGHTFTLIGVDANRVFEAYITSGVQI